MPAPPAAARPQALQADQQADGEQKAPMSPGERHPNPLQLQQNDDHDGGDATSEQHCRSHVDAVVEGDARRHVVGAHHQGNQQQGGEGGGVERARRGGVQVKVARWALAAPASFSSKVASGALSSAASHR